jgi:two-component system chemotaxis sensor kinase CheA
MNTSFQQAFMEEGQEIFNSLENDFVVLETNTTDSELINKIFRELHTLKGSGAMFGFTQLSTFTHELETLFDLIRNEKLGITPEIISISLEAIDLMKVMLNDPENNNLDSVKEKQIIDEIHKLLPESEQEKSRTPEQVKGKEIHVGKQKVFRIYFKPDKDIFTKGINPIVLFRNLNTLGEVFSFAHEEAIPPIDEINPELCYTFWTLILITKDEIDAIKDVFIFAEGSCELNISEIFNSTTDMEQNSIPLIGEILLSKGDITKDEIELLLENRKLFGERAVEMGFTSREKVVSALFEQNALSTVKKEVLSQTATSSIRVQNEKLDILTNAVSELVTLQARLTQFSELKKEAELTSIAEYLEKLTSSLRDTVMMIRMLPVEEGFTSMQRLIRDLAKDLQKEVKLTIIGGDTELDKAVIDNLKDPMMHLIRNCVDHGLEFPDERVAAGKPEIGQVIIKAEHLGSHVIISVIDDGKGLDSQKILAKAIEKGIVSATDSLTELEIFQLIFLPGFSTAEKTTSVSGRGVGMDVVKRNIESIRGEVFIESVRGQGTTIRMKLPITLAIIDGLLFTVGKELFVVNISSVSECLELTPEIRKIAGGRNILKLRDIVVPFVHLRDILNIPGTPPEHEQIIIMHTQEQTLGFVVDSVEGKHQTVVKTTSRLFANVKEVTGATILGDGRIALILDTNVIAQKVNGKHQVNAQVETSLNIEKK